MLFVEFLVFYFSFASPREGGGVGDFLFNYNFELCPNLLMHYQA
jgi:hypothetical protein